MSQEGKGRPPEDGGEEGHDRWAAALERRVAEREERIRRAYEAAAAAVTVPAAERRAWIESQPDCLCPEFVELMTAMARERRGEEPRESVQLAHLAVTAAEVYVEHGGEQGDDARALAWAELGNAHRICGDLRSAGIAFHHAREQVRNVSDPLVRAEAYSLEASYRDYRREFEEAEKLLLKAERIASSVCSPGLLARFQIQRAEILRCLGRVTEAIDCLQKALRWIDPRSEPELALSGVHNLAHYLILAGYPSTARGILRKLRPAYLAFADGRFLARRTWLEALATSQMGDRLVAVHMLETVRGQFIQLDSPYEVALVGLDLAELYFASDRWDEVGVIAQETFELCRGIGVTTEVVATAKLLIEMAARRQEKADETLSIILNLRRMLAPRESPFQG